MNHAARARTSFPVVGAEAGFPVGDDGGSVRRVDRPEFSAGNQPPCRRACRAWLSGHRVAGGAVNGVALAKHDTRMRGGLDGDAAFAGPRRAVFQVRCSAPCPFGQGPAGGAPPRGGTGMCARAFAP